MRPLQRPKLTEFCTKFTGITQEQVDAAAPLSQVLKEFDAFLVEKGLVSDVDWEALSGQKFNSRWGFMPEVSSSQDHPCHRSKASDGAKSFVMATDGPWDIQKFLSPECALKGLTLPWYMCEFVNIRHHFGSFTKSRKCNVNRMLKHFNLVFEGREHSGIDDSRNIARICASLMGAGVTMSYNGSLYS